MSRSYFVKVPICIIGQSLAQYNYPVLCYQSDDVGFSLTLEPGSGGLEVKWLSPIAAYIKRKLSILLPRLEALKVDVKMEFSRTLPLIDSIIVALRTIYGEVGLKEVSLYSLSKRLAVPKWRMRITLEAMRGEGLMAYREGEGLMELQDRFPWAIGLCIKIPSRFKFSKANGFEDSLEAAIHSLGRLIISVARSILNSDFKLFRNALQRYTKLSIALSNLPLTTLKAYEVLSRDGEVACKVDEDFKGFMLFSENEEAMMKCMERARKMGFQALALRG
ncbi:MAG: hypothetical protein QW701_04250 [Candidatus Nezhaarchaeales archaeon]